MKEKSSRKPRKEPLLYITQPPFEGIKANMQETFIIKRKPPVLNMENEERLEAGEISQLEEAASIREEVEEEQQKDLEEAQQFLATAASISTVAEESEAETVQKDREEEPIQEEVLVEEPVLQQETVEQAERDALPSEAAGLHTEPSGAVWKSRPFKEMSHEEKIHFLLHRPHYIPKTKCLIRTTKETYTCYVTALEDDYVILDIFTQNRIKKLSIKLEEILAIHMIGL